MNSEQNLLIHYVEKHTGDALNFIEQFQEKDIASFLESVPVDLAVLLISRMDKFKAAKTIENLEIEMAVNILSKLSFPLSELYLRLIDNELRDKLLDELPAKFSKPLKQTLSYGQNKVGAYIDPFAFILKEEYTVSQSLKRIKKEAPDLASQLFVIDNNQLLTGAVELKKLITAEEEAQIHSIMDKNPPRIKANTEISGLSDNMSPDARYNSLPVVNAEGIFLGIITKEIINKIRGNKTSPDTYMLQTGAALGELYKIGLSGIFRGLTNTENSTKKEK